MARLSSPKPVSYVFIELEIKQLSIFHPLSVKRLSKYCPTVSGIKTSALESNWEFSMESLSVWWSNGKFPILQESFITHCNFIIMYTLPPDVSIVENDFSTLLAWGIYRILKKSKSLFLYF